MRIGIDIRSIGKKRTGDETYTLQLVRNLASIDRKNSYFLYTDTEDSEQLQAIGKKLDLKNNNFKLVPVLPAAKALWTFWALPRQARKDRLDVLHVQYITPIKLATKTKIITTVHDISFARHPGFISKLDLYFLKILIPPSLKNADKVIAVSEFTKEEIMKYYGLGKERIERIYNGGASKRYFEKMPDDKIRAIESKIGLPKKFIFYVGTLQPRKNIPFLIRAFSQLKNEFEDDSRISELNLVVGGARYGHNYDKEIDEEMGKIPEDVKDKILFTGFIDGYDLPALYQASEAFCFTSLYEGFGLPLIEAMASGTPIICNGNSCLKEIAGDAALIYKNQDMNDFVKKLRTLLVDDELKEEISSKGKERAKKFSWEECARDTLKVYESQVQNAS